MQIKGIIFTEREADIIACVLHLRGAKKIAQIFNISPRTIEGHVRSILNKMKINSQDDIKDKVEKSPEAHFFKRRYIKIQIDSRFFEKIKEINSQIDKKEVVCILDFKKYHNLQEIASILKQAGVSIIDQELNELNQKDKFEIIELDDKHIKLVKNSKNITRKIIFVVMTRELLANIQ